MAAPKIIVLGSLNGNLEPAFKKLASLHAKNSFALALLTGDVFTPETDDSAIDALVNGTYTLPLPTYFSVGTHPLPERIAAKVQADEEICPNLHFLGKRSVTKTSEGLRIVSLGGVLDPNLVGGVSREQHLPFYTDDDAKSLRGANSADILLTASWPAGIWKGSKVALDSAHRSQIPASQGIAELCAALKPRYHLSASPGPFFYEREPFIQALADPTHDDAIPVTRFISMAPYGNEAKQKAIYAFSLNKSDNAVPPGATASPLLQPRDKKRPRNDNNDEDGSYSRYGNHHHGDGAHGGRRQKRHRQQQPPPGPDQCFFCLSNPSIATHMVCSIGDDAYITTAKGPLPTSTTFATAEHNNLTIPSHFIIIPLPHTPTLPALGGASDPSSEASKAHREMTRFRASLQSMLASASQRTLGAVTWEISRDRNVHLLWQLVALPADLIARGLAEAALRVEADHHKYPPFLTKEFASLEEEAAFGGDYFRVWLWCESEGDDTIHSKTLVMPLEKDMRFDLQFARRALAKLLGLEKRVVWQDCEQTEEEETKDAEAFREAFKEWDFTLQ